MGIPIPVELGRCTPAVVGGLLSGACPLPADWQRGISFSDTACFTPTVMGECPTCPDLKPTQRADTATFRPVSVISAIECATFGGIDVQQAASQALTETTDYAIARELLTGEASRRDANPNAIEGAGGNPSLQGDAVNLGAGFTDPVAAAGCLEQAIADATGGRRGYLLVGPEIALAMAAADIVVREGGRLTTITGTRVIVDGGFDGRAPIDPESPGESPGDCIPWNSTGAPDLGDPLYMYAVAGVWAGFGSEAMYADVNRENNTASARAEAPVLAVFTPCAVFAAASGVTKAC
jgi:hypothetical protein